MYEVRNSSAHAWVEALAVGKSEASEYDWIVLDPTPAAEAAVAPGALEQWQLSGRALWRDLILGYVGAPAGLWDDLAAGRLLAPAAAWPALGLLLLWLLLRQRGRRAPRRGRPAPAALYARLLDLLERHGPLRPTPDETPAELARRAAAFLASRPRTAALADVPARVVAVYYSLRYSGRDPGETVVREAAGRLDALATALRQG